MRLGSPRECANEHKRATRREGKGRVAGECDLGRRGRLSLSLPNKALHRGGAQTTAARTSCCTAGTQGNPHTPTDLPTPKLRPLHQLTPPPPHPHPHPHPQQHAAHMKTLLGSSPFVASRLALAAAVLLVVASSLPTLTLAQDGTAIPLSASTYSVASVGDPASPVQVDFFLDLVCSDTKAAWPNVKEVIAAYGRSVHWRFHQFPLPYHTNAFVGTSLSTHSPHTHPPSLFL